MNWLKLRTGAGGELLCSAGDRPFVEVDLKPCFPLSHPDEYLALLGRDGREIALVESPMNLDLESRKALERVLGAAQFVVAVTAVRSIGSVGDVFVWKIESEQGQRTIQTTCGEWPRPLEHGGALVEDVSGDLYRIPPLEFLDAQSRRALEPLVG